MAKRELTDSEQAAMEKAWDKHFNDEPRLSLYDSLEAGFSAALDHAADKIAALQAERDVLRQRISDAYQKFGGGHHPYSAGAVDALDYVSGGKENEARRALCN